MADSLLYNLRDTYKNNSSNVNEIKNELINAYSFNKSLDTRALQLYTLTMAREIAHNLGSSPSQDVTDKYNRTGQSLNDSNPSTIHSNFTYLNQHRSSFGPLAYYSLSKHLSEKPYDLYKGNINDINKIIKTQWIVYQFCQSIITQFIALNAAVQILLTTPLNILRSNEDEKNDIYDKLPKYSLYQNESLKVTTHDLSQDSLYSILRTCNIPNTNNGTCKTIKIVWDYTNNRAQVGVSTASKTPSGVIANKQRGWVLINGINSTNNINNSWTSSYILMNGVVNVDGYITKNDGFKVGQKMICTIENDFNTIIPQLFATNDTQKTKENVHVNKYHLLFNEQTQISYRNRYEPEQRSHNSTDIYLDKVNREIVAASMDKLQELKTNMQELEMKLIAAKETIVDELSDCNSDNDDNESGYECAFSPLPSDWDEEAEDETEIKQVENQTGELHVFDDKYDEQENNNIVYESSVDNNGNYGNQYVLSSPPCSDDEKQVENQSNILCSRIIYYLAGQLKKNNLCKFALLILLIAFFCLNGPAVSVLAAKGRSILKVFKYYPIREENNVYTNEQCVEALNINKKTLKSNDKAVINYYTKIPMIRECEDCNEQYDDKKYKGCMDVAIIYRYEFTNELSFKKLDTYSKSFQYETKNKDPIDKSINSSKYVSRYPLISASVNQHKIIVNEIEVHKIGNVQCKS